MLAPYCQMNAVGLRMALVHASSELGQHSAPDIPNKNTSFKLTDNFSTLPLCETFICKYLHLSTWAWTTYKKGLLQLTFSREVFSHIHIPSISTCLQARGGGDF